MAVAFTPGQTIGRGDLDIFLTNSFGNPTNAAEITYAIYYVDPGPPELEVPIGGSARVPINPTVGEYYASLAVPDSASAGTYRIRWTFRELVSTPLQQVTQEFAVVVPNSTTTTTSNWTQSEWSMINSLRIQLRDQNPDKFYHFRPPEHEGRIGQYNQVFGQIWEDVELKEYLDRAVDRFNSFPPSTRVKDLNALVREKPEWRSAIIWDAITRACFALQANWVADEFQYSIGGVSLDLEKSSKYEAMAEKASQQFDKATEAKVRTEKFVRGLQQPRFGIGVRSAFGPALARGILSPRNFL